MNDGGQRSLRKIGDIRRRGRVQERKHLAAGRCGTHIKDGMTMRWYYLFVGLVFVDCMAASPPAQAQLAPNLHYDGRVTLARLQYTPVGDPGNDAAGCVSTDSPAGPGWGHDYPMSVQGLMKALAELTTIQSIGYDSNLVLTIDNPEIMRHPIAMLTEPGCWDPTDVETKALREYLLKGGFLVADDFTFSDCTPEHCELAIERFEAWMRKVLPEGRVVHLPAGHPIFDGFFKLDPTDVPGVSEEPAQVVGVYLNNDPQKRLLLVGNYWTALGHMWRYVDNDLGSGLEQGGAAYRLGLNYVMYGLSH